MTKRMMTSALFAGVAAGLIAVLLHFAFVQKLILLGEQYESGALTHFQSGDHATDMAQEATPETGHHHHGAPSDWRRDGLTVLFMILVYCAYGLLLTAGFGLAESMGHRIGPGQGILWGIAGFATFQLAPAMGLPPELPGTIAADLGARQIWWWGTVIGTGAGLALLTYGRKIWMFVLAGAVVALPHVIGAPQAEGFFGASPPELAAGFSARVLGTALVVWACLGWLAGHFWASEAP